MKDTDPARRLEPTTLGQFREFVRKIILVPKSTIEKKEMEYRNRRIRKKRKHSPLSD